MEEFPDEKIMLEVKNGNTELLSVLFRRHHKHLFNYFMQTGIECHQSEDFMQQVFYRILKYRHSYREDAIFKKWMFTIARNIVRRYYEKHKHMKLQTFPEKLIYGVADNNDTLEKEEKIKDLYRALEKIPPFDRELISLSRFQGLKYEDISEITGISVGAIKVKIHRAMKKLREYYFAKA
jgi:RNA polymerase sigma-70 factor (ECF subfamily)